MSGWKSRDAERKAEEAEAEKKAAEAEAEINKIMGITVKDK
jgi:hypothetical protein